MFLAPLLLSAGIMMPSAKQIKVSDSNRVVFISYGRSRSSALWQVFLNSNLFKNIHYLPFYKEVRRPNQLVVGEELSAAEVENIHQKAGRVYSEPGTTLIKDAPHSFKPLVAYKQFVDPQYNQFLFLIRNPEKILKSFYRITGRIDKTEIEFRHMLETIQQLEEYGYKPIVLDASDMVQANKEKTVRKSLQILKPGF